MTTTIPAYAGQVSDEFLSENFHSAIVRAERVVADGTCLCRTDDGEVVFADGAWPGELVSVSLIAKKKTQRGPVMEILESSPDRITPQCEHARQGCGGCDWATINYDAQLLAKVEVVRDSLRRLGRWAEPVISTGPVLDPWAFRTSMRFGVQNGAASLRRAATHDLVEISLCEIAHPKLNDIANKIHWGNASEITIRVGANSGESLVKVSPSTEGLLLNELQSEFGTVVVGENELKAKKRAWYNETVAGRTFRISADSFFQTRSDGAAALIEVVGQMCADAFSRSTGQLLDAYCGVGLFSGALLPEGWTATAAERSRSSVADAKQNLSDLPIKVIGSSIERLRTSRCDVVIADPSRAGLGRGAVKNLSSTGASVFVLVSCDPASAGRDIALLQAEGFTPSESVVVDLFPHSHHIELVTKLTR